MSTAWTQEMAESNARKVAAGQAKARAKRFQPIEVAPVKRFAEETLDERAARLGFAPHGDAPLPRQDAQGDVLPPKTAHDSGGGVKFTIPGVIMGAPRMTRADAWKKRPCVQRYWAWKNASRQYLPPLPKDPVTVNWTAWLPIPKSWSDKKKAAMRGQLHQQKPDRDNIDKSVLDFLFSEDAGISSGKIEKRWDDGLGPRIEIEVL